MDRTWGSYSGLPLADGRSDGRSDLADRRNGKPDRPHFSPCSKNTRLSATANCRYWKKTSASQSLVRHMILQEKCYGYGSPQPIALNTSGAVTLLQVEEEVKHLR
jgi:hypothetical protein